MKRIILILTVALAACAASESKQTPEGIIVVCKPLIKYSGTTVQLTLPTLTFPTGKSFDLGKIFVEEKQLQEAQELTQTLDVLQFNDCQRSLLLPPDQRREMMNKREETLKLLMATLSRLDAAKSKHEYQSAIDETKVAKDQLAK